MCGIAGTYRFDGAEPNLALVEAQIASLRHRGPDERGTVRVGPAALGIARLSIVDVEGGQQPVWNEDRTICLVFNGEIYNHHELRAELIAAGHSFRSHSDSEVIVHLFEEKGCAAFGALNGMFAIALYDTRSKRLVLARDRYGIKPLFVTSNPGRLSFASEIKALLADPDTDRALDPQGLGLALSLMFIPEPWTSFREIRKLRGGYLLCADSAGVREERFADICFEPRTIRASEAVEGVGHHLDVAVRRQSRTEVGASSLLSGGLDSSLVSFLMTRQVPSAPAFGIAFDDPRFDESYLASRFAAGTGIDFVPVTLSEATVAAVVHERQQHLDEPCALWRNIATWFLASKIRERGYKVALGGDGGDELFFGYPTVHAAHVLRAFTWLPGPVVRNVAALAEYLPAGRGRLPLSFKIKSFLRAFGPDLVHAFFRFKEVLGPQSWEHALTPAARAFLRESDPLEACDQYRSRIVSMPLCDALAYLDFKIFLSGWCLADGDAGFMASSVELRVPFLDNELVNYVTSLPHEIRFNLTTPKSLLKRVAGRTFRTYPADVWSHIKKKRGFSVPGATWLAGSGPFHDVVTSVLSHERLRKVGFFDARFVQTLLERQRSARDNTDRQLQTIMSCQLFFERFDMAWS